MNAIETPPGKFTDAAFHVWETVLGEKIASHVTLFRDRTIKGLFEKNYDGNKLSMFKDFENRKFQTCQL